MIRLETLRNNKYYHKNGWFKGQNNLDLYLNDVFIKECVFKITDEEVVFIQTGIESIVQECLDTFTLTDRSENIIKVGSFYEQTKNDFPDEFDFIFLYGCVEGDFINWEDPYKSFGLLRKMLREKIDLRVKRYAHTRVEDTHSKKCISLDLPSSFKKDPATCLPFIYENGSGLNRLIHVDIVPAVRVTDNSLTQNVRKLCDLKSFCPEILATGSYLLVVKGDMFLPEQVHVSFTETEVHFMRNVLSENHRKVYRILKYLINGHGDGEKLEMHFRQSNGKHYSSYKIKTMVIYHHYECKNSNKASIGPCVLQILNEICKYSDDGSFPVIASYSTMGLNFGHQYPVKNHVEVLNVFLQSLILQPGDYKYEKYRINKSVSKRYADDHGIV